MNFDDQDRMTNLGDLASVLAHEMKNPMNSIIINLEVLRGSILDLQPAGVEHPQSIKAKRCLDIIEGEVRRLDKVLRGFLDFANPPQSTKLKFKVNPVIKIIADFMTNEFSQKEQSIELKLSSNSPEIVGSTDEFKQVLLNLMLNALQAMPKPGGKLLISTETIDSKLRISFQDTGIGIPDEVKSRIFDPYFTTKTRGSGLGLTVVKRFVKELSGEITLESQMGKGSTFRIELPCKS